MRNRWIKVAMLLSAFSSMFALTGCMEPDPAQTIAQASDKHMMQAVAKYGNTYTRNSDMIAEKVYISGKKGHVDGSLGAVEGGYAANFFILEEPLTQAYIKAAKSRGNIVKLYKKSVSKAIGNATPAVFQRESGERVFFDWDPALIEFDKNGNIVSVLIQKHRVSEVYSPAHAFLHYRYSIVITGKTASRLIYTIGNDVLNNGYIKQL